MPILIAINIFAVGFFCGLMAALVNHRLNSPVVTPGVKPRKAQATDKKTKSVIIMDDRHEAKIQDSRDDETA